MRLFPWADADGVYFIEPPSHWTSHSNGIQRYVRTKMRGSYSRAPWSRLAAPIFGFGLTS